jgi:hypothetical protein
VEWHEFPESEKPTVLTGASNFQRRDYGQYPGRGCSEEHCGQLVFCTCPLSSGAGRMVTTEIRDRTDS